MKKLKSYLTCWLGMWSQFWFSTNERGKAGFEHLRRFEFVFLVALFVLYLNRIKDLKFFYSEQGILPYRLIHDLAPMDYRWSVLFYFDSVAAIYFFFGLFLFSALAAALCSLEEWNRLKPLFLFLVFVLHVSFMHRNIAILYGVDSISTFFTLYLLVGSLGGIFKSFTRDLTQLSVRLVQLQICIIYFYSGIEKLRGKEWWDGTALWSVIANAQLVRFDFGFLSHFPVLIIVGTYLSLLWEVYFPVLVWLPRLRKVVLLFGVGLHFMIAITVNIPYFSLMMVCSYLSFLKKGDSKTLDFIFKRIDASAKMR